MPSVDEVVRALSSDDEISVSIDNKYDMLYRDGAVVVGETILVDDGTFSVLVGMTAEPHVQKEAEALAQELIRTIPNNSPQEQVLAVLATCEARFEIGGAFPDELAELFHDHEDIFNRLDENLEALVDGIIFDPDSNKLL